MQVPLLDLRPQYESLKPSVLERLHGMFDSQQFILGPAVASFEQAICTYTGARHAIGLSSGTDAQLALLMAEGIGPGDAIVTTPFTFFATAGCISRVGARPMFVDIEPSTMNLCPDRLDHFFRTQCDTSGEYPIRNGLRVRGVIPVHLFGACADMDAITAVCERYRVSIWEDAAQALGAEYRGTKVSGHAGCLSAAGWYSFFPAKNLGAFGDAGMLVCQDDALAARVRSIRNHGMEPQYYHKVVGGNFRIDALQAAVLEIKLPHLDEWSSQRRANADYYRERFQPIEELVLPAEPWARRGFERHHIYHQYVIRSKLRDALQAALQAAQIGNAIYYPMPLHLQECFRDLGYKAGDFPEAEKACGEVLALPIFPELGEDRRAFVADTVAGFFR